MLNAFSRFLYHDININKGFLGKVLLTYIQRRQSQKLFSASSAFRKFNHRPYNEVTSQKKQLPSLFYIQNPVTWLINKIDFIMLRNAWDSEFVEEEFRRGVKQAVSVICTLITKNNWTDMRGLVTSKTLARLQRDVEVNWKEDQKQNIALEPSDIKLVLIRKVHFLRIADQRFVDVDVICVAMKFREQVSSSNDADIIIVEILARFHRNYAVGQLPNWTVTVFKVSSQNVKSKE